MTAPCFTGGMGLYAGHKGGDDHCMPVASVMRALKVTSWALVALGLLLLATGVLSGLLALVYVAVVLAMSITEWVLRDGIEARHKPDAR
ncbi:ABC-type Na+ efflux pump permease subunit [Paenarthrobacter nitroguajacolicus]|uniref:hypothetical protein n=1 Tax=Paenarthrobacter nitroguajacolicus TaxID=211146 RepID=UPI00285C1F0A|nr:hypothetical protein [Paenarthrobacter nitroguajacolicus]MDR6988963.1 ABC-type Na+ efflux pump permease subunit [Paenarthrobacter nitroguajacolicus]